MIHKSQFRAPFWSRNAHLQTIWASKVRKFPLRPSRTTEFHLEDGDFLDLVWSSNPDATEHPIIVLFHGLEGSAESNYIIGMQAALALQNMTSVVMHFRGCSGRPNLLDRGYHSGETSDAKCFIQSLRRAYPNRLIGAIGYSLGGNMLTKLLGEEGAQSPLNAAAVVCAPLDLAACSHRMAKGFSRQYQRYLLKSMKSSVERKISGRGFRHFVAPDLEEIRQMRSFVDFDDKITGPLHGFQGAADYYLKCSGKPFVRNIKTPTLMVHAKDDPFMTDQVIPDASSIPECIHYEVSNHGGHVGFVYGYPWAPRYWLEERLPAWFSEQFQGSFSQG